MATTKQARKVTAKPVTKSAVPVTVEVSATPKATAAERLEAVLTLIGKSAVIDPSTAEVKFGKAVGLVGGGAVYINRSNADVRLTTGQVQALAKTIKGSTVRGPQGQYLRIAF